MAAVPYKVYVVVDREFGEKLAGLERGVPVWIVDTPTNKPVAQRFWNKHPVEDHLTGITTFNDLNSLSPEEMLLGHLDTIELHHGSHSADPPYTVIEVFGAQLTAKVMRKRRCPNTVSTPSTSPRQDSRLAGPMR